MSRSFRARLAVLCGATVALAGGCSNPRQAAYINDQMTQAADAIADIRTNMAGLQSSIDSLRTIVAKQDSTIVKLAVATNVQVVR